MLQLQKENYVEAIRHLSKAVELGISDAGVYNYLGIGYSRTGQFAKAVGSYQKALALNPKLAATRVNLADVYERMNRPKDAEAEYKAACQLDERFCALGKAERP